MKGKGGKGTSKRTRSSKCLHGDQVLTDHSEPTMMEDVSQLDTSFDADKSKKSLKKSMGSKSSNENIIVALFGVPLSSIEDLDVLTRKIKAGDYDEIKKGMLVLSGKPQKEDTPIVKSVSFTKPISYVEAARASSLKRSTGKANFHHLVSDNVFDVVQLSILMNLVQTAKYGLTRLMMNSKDFFFFKFNSIKGLEDVLENGPWMIRNSLIILKKWTMNTRPCKEEAPLILVWVKIHDCLKNVTTIPTIMNNDGFQTMVNKKNGKTVIMLLRLLGSLSNKREKPSKAANDPSSSYTCGSAKNGGLQDHSSASNIHTSNPYDALDDMENDEEVEVVFDETINLFGNNITRWLE
nr:hypothetical protein [Tanacetum cinerariifolium]